MTIIALITAALLVVIDQITKQLVISNMEVFQSVNLIKIGDTEVFNLTYVTNNGAAWNLLDGKRIFLIALTAVVIAVAIFFLLTKRVKGNGYIWAISLFVAGGLGNLIDRIFNPAILSTAGDEIIGAGNVTDFIEFKLINFPVFNIADICAVIGAILIFLFVLIDEIKEVKAKKAAKAAENVDTDKGGNTVSDISEKSPADEADESEEQIAEKEDGSL